MDRVTQTKACGMPARSGGKSLIIRQYEGINVTSLVTRNGDVRPNLSVRVTGEK
jgi:hypothetical protein